MGLSASQARLISLTARMNDIEYQGQQINQQRTSLSNQVNALYDKLVSMSVPTPPSTTDFTKIEYAGAMGSDNFTIESVRPDGQYYMVNLAFQEHGHFLEGVGNVRIVFSGGQYYVGTEDSGDVLVTLADATADPPPPGVQPLSSPEQYYAAIRNSFPEFAELTDDEIRDNFYVYFEDVPGSITDKPHFFLKTDVEGMLGDFSYINMYDYIANGSYTSIKTYHDVKLTFDASGRIDEMYLPNYNDVDPSIIDSWTKYNLAANKKTDNEAYEDAFSKYEYQKYLYDKEQQRINAQTSIIQAEDKNLELKLTRLDNERNAVKTEMDAVKKVVDDNIEKSFKTFSG